MHAINFCSLCKSHEILAMFLPLHSSGHGYRDWARGPRVGQHTFCILTRHEVRSAECSEVSIVWSPWLLFHWYFAGGVTHCGYVMTKKSVPYSDELGFRQNMSHTSKSPCKYRVP